MNPQKRRLIPSPVAGVGLAAIAAGTLLVGARPVRADACMQEVWAAHGNTQNLTCKANDVTLSSVSDICVHIDPDAPGEGANCQAEPTCILGQDVTFTGTYSMPLTAKERFDLGLYVSEDGLPSALTGTCHASVLTAENSPTFFLSPNDGQFGAGDLCGDIDDLNTPQEFRQTVTTQCTDADEDGRLDLGFCTTWRQPGADELCDTTEFTTAEEWDAYPGSPSKCNCGVLDIDIFTEVAQITVIKTAEPVKVGEGGGEVTYTVEVFNEAQVASVTLDGMMDNPYGDITMPSEDIIDTTCKLVTIQAGDVDDGDPTTVSNPYTCAFKVAMPQGDPGDEVTDVVEVCGTDSFDNSVCGDDDATVTYVDTPSTPTLAKTAAAVLNVTTELDVRFDVDVTNTTTVGDVLTLEELSDSKFGEVTAVHPADGPFGEVVSTTCGPLPVVIQPNATYSCSFVGKVITAALFDPDTQSVELTHENRVSGVATDDDNFDYGDPPLGDDATVNISVDVGFE